MSIIWKLTTCYERALSISIDFFFFSMANWGFVCVCHGVCRINFFDIYRTFAHIYLHFTCLLPVLFWIEIAWNHWSTIVITLKENTKYIDSWWLPEWHKQKTNRMKKNFLSVSKMQIAILVRLNWIDFEMNTNVTQMARSITWNENYAENEAREKRKHERTST